MLPQLANAIQWLKFNKASGHDGLPAEVFKAGGDELVSYLHHILCNIWSLESMLIGVLVCSAYLKRAMKQYAAEFCLAFCVRD